MVADDDELLDQVQRQVGAAVGLPADELVRSVRSAVAEVMLATYPDGSWPDAALIREAVSMAVDVLDAPLAGQGISAAELDGDGRRWLDACRTVSHSAELLDDMLDDLRSGLRPPGPSVNTTT